MSHATRTPRLASPPNTSLHLTGDTTAPGEEYLLHEGEDPSPTSGVRTGLILMALLAIFSVFTVSLYSPDFPGEQLRLVLWGFPVAALLVVLFLHRSL